MFNYYIDWGSFGLNTVLILLVIYLFTIFIFKTLSYFNIWKYIYKKIIYYNINIKINNNRTSKGDIHNHIEKYNINPENWQLYNKFHKTVSSIVFIIITSCYLYMCYQFLLSNFFYINVFDNSHNNQPFFYKVCSLWGNHEGSMLLWLWILSFYNFLFSIISKKQLLYKIYNNTLIINHLIILFFVIFILYTSNPFLSLLFYSVNGSDLNPILQDPVLLIHPPLIYCGYLGFLITFSISLTTILFSWGLNKKVDYLDTKMNYVFLDNSLSMIRLFNLISWIFLTFGIFLGSWWAYYELGWGGWWFWDPVENASLIPWLFSTALLHTVISSIRKKVLLNWTFFLSITTFISSLIGTFFVRSGLLNSVHSFANDSGRGLFLLLIIIVLSIMSYSLLIIFKYNNYKSDKFFSLISREGFIVLNSAFLSFFSVFIFLGTITPVLFLMISNRDISLGNAFYNDLLIPLFIPFIILMIFGPLLRWSTKNNYNIENLFINKNIITFNLSIIISFIILKITIMFKLLDLSNDNVINEYFSLLDKMSYITQLNLVFSFMLILNLVYVYSNSSSLGNSQFIISHLGFSIIILGVIISTNFYQEINQIINYGESIILNDYHYVLRHFNLVEAPNYNSIYANFLIYKENIDNTLCSLFPEKRLYLIQNIFTTKASIQTNLFNDLYVVIGDGNIKSGWFVKIYWQPTVSFIWLGSLVMVFGGLYILNKLNLSTNNITWFYKNYFKEYNIKL